MKIVFLDRDTISPDTVLRAPAFAHDWVAYPRTDAHQTAERIADADVVVVNKVKLPAEVLAQAPKLKLIAVAATGTSRTSRTHYVQRSRAGGSHQQGLEGKVRCKGGCP